MNNLPATLNDRLNQLTQRANAQSLVKNWQPAAGESIAGIITGSGTFTHSLYGDQKTMLLRDASGSVTSVILNKYLMQGLRQQNAAIGDLCAVTFHGKERGKSGHSFNRYTLLIEKMEADL